MYRVFVSLLFLVHFLHVAAQNKMMLMGARANGMGFSSSCLTDHWAVFNNIAGIAELKNPVASTSYMLHPAIPSFNTLAAIYAQPLKLGTIGFGISRFGDDLYNEQGLTVGYSNSFGIASLGLKVNYIQYHAEGFGNKGLVNMSFGGLVQLTPQFQVGAHIINLTQPKITEYEKLPTSFILGMAYQPTDNLFVTTEIEKDIELDARWKAGIEYVVHKKFFLRTGFNLRPQAGFFGFGYKPKQALQLDYAFSLTPIMSHIHQATIGFHFKNKSK